MKQDLCIIVEVLTTKYYHSLKRRQMVVGLRGDMETP